MANKEEIITSIARIVSQIDLAAYTNPWNLSAEEPVPEEIPNDVLCRDVFETEEEYESRIKRLPAIKIGEAILDKNDIDINSNICSLRYFLEMSTKNIGTAICQEEIDAIYADLKIVKDFEHVNGDLYANLIVSNGVIYVNYETLVLRNDGIEFPLVAVKWQKFEYENELELSKRLQALPVLPLGKVAPIRSEYDLVKENLPFRFVPYEFVKSIIKDLKINLYVSVDLAKKVCAVKGAAVLYGKIDENLTMKVVKVVHKNYTIGKVRKTLSCKLGDIIEFGRYHIKDANSTDAIKWQVLDVKDNKALLISCEGLDVINFDEYSNVWMYSQIKTWLNHTFYDFAFNENDKQVISKSITDNGLYDKVFLISLKEHRKYFKTGKQAVCYHTKYAKSRGAYSNGGICAWWTRTAVDGTSNRIIYNTSGGFINLNGQICIPNDMCVRPAIWVYIE